MALHPTSSQARTTQQRSAHSQARSTQHTAAHSSTPSQGRHAHLELVPRLAGGPCGHPVHHRLQAAALARLHHHHHHRPPPVLPHHPALAVPHQLRPALRVPDQLGPQAAQPEAQPAGHVRHVLLHAVMQPDLLVCVLHRVVVVQLHELNDHAAHAALGQQARAKAARAHHLQAPRAVQVSGRGAAAAAAAAAAEGGVVWMLGRQAPARGNSLPLPRSAASKAWRQ